MKAVMGLFIVGSLWLTGCSNLNEDFDCPAAKGGSCKRMDEIYAIVNGTNGNTSAPARNQQVLERKPAAARQYSEGTMRVWVAPYQDTDGNYHQANQLYSVVREAPQNTVLAAK